jgi:hypothetical protein
MREVVRFSVMPAKAGISSNRSQIFWIHAFAGMTLYIAMKLPTASGRGIQKIIINSPTANSNNKLLITINQ